MTKRIFESDIFFGNLVERSMDRKDLGMGRNGKISVSDFLDGFGIFSFEKKIKLLIPTSGISEETSPFWISAWFERLRCVFGVKIWARNIDIACRESGGRVSERKRNEIPLG